MRIFNWVHRKLYHVHPEGYISSPKKDDFTFNVNKHKADTEDIDTRLLGQVTLLDIWKDGILTIGTLGYDHGQDDYCTNKEEKQEEEDEKQEDEEEEEKHSVPNEKLPLDPLVHNPFIPKAQTIDLASDSAVTKLDVRTTDIEITPDTTPLLELTEVSEVTVRKRITLADLLSVEADMVDIPNSIKVPVESASNEEKNVPPFGKKHKGEHPRPPRKLHRMITKLLKKKIYPDIEGKSNAKDGHKDSSKKKNDSSERETIEMVALL